MHWCEKLKDVKQTRKFDWTVFIGDPVLIAAVTSMFKGRRQAGHINRTMRVAVKRLIHALARNGACLNTPSRVYMDWEPPESVRMAPLRVHANYTVARHPLPPDRHVYWE
jgi:hypothetical protein